MLLLLCLASCHVGRRAKVTPELDPTVESTPANNSPGSTEEMEGKLTEIGPVTVVGILGHTKGRLGQLDKFILPVDFLTGGQGQPWKPEYEAMVGKKVEAKGVHFSYRCSPIEQCLEGGVIDYLNHLEYLRLAR